MVTDPPGGSLPSRRLTIKPVDEPLDLGIEEQENPKSTIFTDLTPLKANLIISLYLSFSQVEREYFISLCRSGERE